MPASVEPLNPEDWDKLIQRCFDNRETDIARFFQRNLPGIAEELRRLGASTILASDLGPKPEIKGDVKAAVKKLDEGTMWFEKRLNHLAKQANPPSVPPEAGWREVAVVVRGSIGGFTPQSFLDHLFAHQPRVSGWPIWIDSRHLRDPSQHPYPNPPAWEALVRNNNFPGRYTSDLIDFWRIEPVCSFYHRRLYYEDITTSLGDQRTRSLDFTTSISMVTEAISVATAFAGALSTKPDSNHLEIAFRWNRLRGRELGAFLDPTRDLISPKPAYQDEAASVIEVELANPRTTLARYVAMAVRPLFGVFGYTAAQSVIEDVVDKTVNHSIS